MFGVVDVQLLIAATVLGLVLGAAIIAFFIYAAITASRTESDHANTENLHHIYGVSYWSRVARPDLQRGHAHLLGRDHESAGW